MKNIQKKTSWLEIAAAEIKRQMPRMLISYDYLLQIGNDFGVGETVKSSKKDSRKLTSSPDWYKKIKEVTQVYIKENGGFAKNPANHTYVRAIFR